MPGVAGGDDFRSEYSVRGSPYRHAGLVVNGVAAPWLQHAALGRGNTGTLTMLRGDMVGEASLLAGAYPRRDGSQIGPQLNLTLREGSRTTRRFQVGATTTGATLTAEGPVGGSTRGSWLVGVRQSYVEWPVGRSDHDGTVFAFGDVQSKVVYDVRPDQQLSVSLVAGLSAVERDDPSPLALGRGTNRAAMMTLAWRSVAGSRTIVTQRVSSTSHDFVNRNQAAEAAGRGTNGAAGYRVDVVRSFFGGVIEAGGQLHRVRGSRDEAIPVRPSAPIPLPIDASWLQRAGHASFRRSIVPGVTLGAGLRAASSTLVERRSIDRWLEAEWAIGPRWLLHGSSGVAHQLPALEQIHGWSDPSHLRPEQAAYVDAGVAHQLSSSIRWDVTVFARHEHDVFRDPGIYWPIDSALDTGALIPRFENVLDGSARGVELTIERRTPNGVSGWVGYSVRHRTPHRRDDRRTFRRRLRPAPCPQCGRLGAAAGRDEGRPDVPRWHELPDSRVRRCPWRTPGRCRSAQFREVARLRPPRRANRAPLPRRRTQDHALRRRDEHPQPHQRWPRRWRHRARHGRGGRCHRSPFSAARDCRGPARVLRRGHESDKTDTMARPIAPGNNSRWRCCSRSMCAR